MSKQDPLLECLVCGWIGEPDDADGTHCPKCGSEDMDDLDDEEE